MSITSSERPFDMSAWVSEKSDKALSSACKVVDILKEAGTTLSDAQQERLTFHLSEIIYNAAKLSSFGHEQMNSFNEKSVRLMVSQGSAGLRKYQQKVGAASPFMRASSQYPRSVENLLSLFDPVQKLLTTNSDNKQLLGDNVEKLGQELQKSKFDQVRAVGDDLLKLLGRFRTNTLSWSQFVREATILTKQGRKTLLKNAENALTFLGDLAAAHVPMR